MKQEKIDRINELARKAKAEALTDEELAERDALRREYIDSVKQSLRAANRRTQAAPIPRAPPVMSTVRICFPRFVWFLSPKASPRGEAVAVGD